MPRSVFDLSRGHKTTLDSGKVVPLFLEEVLPGDTFRVKATILMRLATLLYPLMDNLYVDCHFFFVPMRLVWSSTEKFFGQQDNPGDSTSYVIPKTNTGLVTSLMDLADYFGVPRDQLAAPSLEINCLPFRGYRRVWNEWYRDQNLQNSVTISYGAGPDTGASQYDVLPRNKRGDYFTLALPWAQKGTAVVMPTAGTGVASIYADNVALTPTFKSSTGATAGGALIAGTTADQPPISVTSPTGSWTSGQALYWDNPNLIANVAGVMGTINQFRQANAMQVYLERNARGGTRYPEYLKAQWGVTSSDARLQRTEYLGGGSAPVVVSPISQQSASEVDNPLGKLGGVGTASSHGAGFVKSFEEHGYVYGMVSVRADLNYQNGIRRLFLRSTVFDLANPVFANIGEQPVYIEELYYNGTNPRTVFGYQERFAEYKQSYSTLSGNMRSGSANSYDVWHVAQNFPTAPTLGDTFIVEDPDVDRVVATPFVDQWILDSVFDVKVARCLPVWGVPGLGGRF